MIRKCYNLVTAGFYGTCFMDIYMCGVGGQDTIVMVKQTVYHHGICLSTTLKKVHGTVFDTTFREYQLFRCFSEFITSIADGVKSVGLIKAFHHIRMRPYHIIVVEINHTQRYA